MAHTGTGTNTRLIGGIIIAIIAVILIVGVTLLIYHFTKKPVAAAAVVAPKVAAPGCAACNTWIAQQMASTATNPLPVNFTLSTAGASACTACSPTHSVNKLNTGTSVYNGNTYVSATSDANAIDLMSYWS
jgi:hypothetical protein